MDSDSGLVAYVWSDTTWQLEWSNKGTGFFSPAGIHPPERDPISWKTFDLDDDITQMSWFLASEVVNGELSEPDTVARVSVDAVYYSASSTLSREWIAIWNRTFNPLPSNGQVLHVFERAQRDSVWSRRAIPLRAGAGIASAALSDTAVLLVGVDVGVDVRWGILGSSGWRTTADSVLSNQGRERLGPMRRDGEGGFWALWATNDSTCVLVRWRATGGWTRGDTLVADYPPPAQQYFTDNPVLSQDPWPRPVVGWIAYGKRTPAYNAYVSWPTATGWTRGEVIPGSFDAGLPQLARDENGDLWAAWAQFGSGIYWTHTYTRAVTDTPTVGEASGRPQIRWRLSELAPETWWGVLRSVEGGPYERIARLEADSALTMTYTDTTAPSNRELRYRIRRESKDKRYEWQSAEAAWTPRLPRLALTLLASNPNADRIALEVAGASAGALEMRMYDLLGRVVVTHRVPATGSGRDTVTLPLDAGLHAGLYLLRARAADGRESRAVKVTVLR